MIRVIGGLAAAAGIAGLIVAADWLVMFGWPF